jgi:hypothetical protein
MQSNQCPDSDSCARRSSRPTPVLNIPPDNSHASHHHFSRRACLRLARVPLPRAPRTAWSSRNFFFAYERASASSMSSSTSVRLRLAPSFAVCGANGERVSTIVPIYHYPHGSAQGGREDEEPRTHSKVFGQAFDALAFAFIFPVKAFGVELIA